MYRSNTLEEISGMITVYQNSGHIPDVSIDYVSLQGYIDDPTLPKLIRIIKGDDSELIQAVLASLRCSINKTSVDPYTKNDAILMNFLADIDLAPIYSASELETIVRYRKMSGTSTSVISNQQMNAVADFFDGECFAYTLSGSGFTDIDYDGRKGSAKADGELYVNGHKIIIYMRYGSSGGGSQNDRWRQMFSTAYRHHDKMFLFVVDGAEAVQQYSLCKKEFAKCEYPNAMWSTVKYLDFIDFDKFIDSGISKQGYLY